MIGGRPSSVEGRIGGAAEVERHGGSATTRPKAEEALAAAKLRAAEPWAERVEGAKAAARDVDKTYRGTSPRIWTNSSRYSRQTAGSPPNESTPQPPT